MLPEGSRILLFLFQLRVAISRIPEMAISESKATFSNMLYAFENVRTNEKLKLEKIMAEIMI